MNGMNGLKPLVDAFGDLKDPIFENNSIVEITEVNNIETKRWQDVRVEVLNAVVEGDKKIDFLIRSNTGEQKILSVKVNEDILKKDGDVIKNIGIVQMNPELSTTISYVQNNSPASLAGFQIDDEIISIDDSPVRTWNEYVQIIHNNPGNILQVGVLRNDERIDLIKKSTSHLKNVLVHTTESLIVNFARKNKSVALIRGLRSISDFEYEFQMALMNRSLAPEISTIFMMPDEKFIHLNSTVVKDVSKNGGDVSEFVPSCVKEALFAKYSN